MTSVLLLHSNTTLKLTHVCVHKIKKKKMSADLARPPAGGPVTSERRCRLPSLDACSSGWSLSSLATHPRDALAIILLPSVYFYAPRFACASTMNVLFWLSGGRAEAPRLMYDRASPKPCLLWKKKRVSLSYMWNQRALTMRPWRGKKRKRKRRR